MLVAVTLISVAPIAALSTAANATIATPTTGTLTVHDIGGEVNAPAICLNNWIAATDGRAAPCIEVPNADSPSSSWRYGVYYLDKLEFDATPTFTSGTVTGDDLSSVVSKTCSDGNQFVGMGPVPSNGFTNNYFGEEVSGSNADFARWDGNACTALSGSHALTTTAWLTPTITCAGYAASIGATVTNAATETALETAIAAKDKVICLTGTTYQPTSALTMLVGTKGIIGDPLQRPVIDASGLTSNPTVGIAAGGVTDATIANLAVEGAARCVGSGCTPCTSGPGGCGMGIYANSGFDIYNVLAENNAINGVNAHGFTLEDSAIVHNGNSLDVGNTSGGVKSSEAYKAIWNFVDNNIGVGLWCDSGCHTDDMAYWLVHRNYIRASTRGGIREEISSNPSHNTDIAYNYLVGNVTDTGINRTEHGGIEAVDAQNMLIQYNTFLSNTTKALTGETNQANLHYAFVIAGNDGRSPRPGYIRFQFNTLDPSGNGFDCTDYIGSGSPGDINCS